jgi:hypothetical protein
MYHYPHDLEHIIRTISREYSIMWYADGRCLVWTDAGGFISKDIYFPYDISPERLEALLMLL